MCDNVLTSSSHVTNCSFGLHNPFCWFISLNSLLFLSCAKCVFWDSALLLFGVHKRLWCFSFCSLLFICWWCSPSHQTFGAKHNKGNEQLTSKRAVCCRHLSGESVLNFTTLYGWRDKQVWASVGSGFWDVEEGGRLEWQLLSFRLLCYSVVQLRRWPCFSHVSARWGASFRVIFSLNASGLVPESFESGSGLTHST